MRRSELPLQIRYYRSVSVQEIIEAVKGLDQQQKGEFLEKLSGIDFADAWDRQIELDSKAGKLEKLAEEALEEYRAGKATAFPQVKSRATHNFWRAFSRLPPVCSESQSNNIDYG